MLAVDGTPFKGIAYLGYVLNHATVGVPIMVTVAPKGAAPGQQRTITLPVVPARLTSWDRWSDLVLSLLLPSFSLLLGFWVAFRRPRDPLAWLLLALMLSFPHILQAFIVQGWPAGWRQAGVVYESLLEAAFPIVIYYFGRFFPEPFPPGSRYDKTWKALQWFCALPFAIVALCQVVVYVASLDDYRSVTGLESVLQRLDTPAQICVYILIGSFFSASA